MGEIRTLELNFGRTMLNLAVYRISEFFSEWDRREVCVPHRIGFNAIILVTEGEGRHFIDYRQHNVSRQELLFLSKFQVHCFDADLNLDGYIIAFNDELFNQGREDPFTSEFNSAFLAVSSMRCDDPGLVALADDLFREYHRERGFNAEILRCLVRGIVLKSAVRQFRSHHDGAVPVRDDSAFQRLLDLIELEYCRCRSVSEYAARMCCSVRQLNKLARDHSGFSVKQLVDARVVLELKRLLTCSNLSIAAIAAEAGFMESTNMTKFFRHHTGRTPSEFRELSRGAVAEAEVISA